MPAAVRVLETVNDLPMLREPEKELETAPVDWRELAVKLVPIVADLVVFREPVNEDEVVVALMEKILEMEATTPDEDDISKYASGVVSPSPNLPEDILENLAKVEPRELFT